MSATTGRGPPGDGIFEGLAEPGDTPTLFVGMRSLAQSAGICLRWRWSAEGGFDPAVRVLLGDPEPEEAFLDCSALVAEATGRVPRGIRMFPSDLERARTLGARLEGGSLGLPFLLGALCWAEKLSWPGRVLAWGAVQPARGDRWRIVPTTGTAAKALLARELGADAMLHAALDGVPGVAPYPRAIPLQSQDGVEAAGELLAMLRGGSVL